MVSQKKFEHGMRLLGEPLTKAGTFQAHVARLAMETSMRVARYRVVHPHDTRGPPSRRKASDEYASELNRSGLKEMPTTKRFYVGLPPSKRTPLLIQWKISFPAPERTFLDNWMHRKEGPAPMSRGERGAIKNAAAAARRKAHPGETT